MVSWLARLARLAACRYSCIPLLGAALLVGGCEASTSVSTASAGTATPTATATLAPTATASPSPTPVSIVKHEEFTCPETVSGADKVIADSSIFLSVAYPATWKETHCIRNHLSDGSVTLWIGNYVHIDAVPDTTMTVQQWVDAHKTSYETITLQPITVRQALEAVSVTDQVDQSAPSTAYFHFLQVGALLRGSHYIYVLTTSLDVAYQNTSIDTVIPGPLRNYVADWSVS